MVRRFIASSNLPQLFNNYPYNFASFPINIDRLFQIKIRTPSLPGKLQVCDDWILFVKVHRFLILWWLIWVILQVFLSPELGIQLLSSIQGANELTRCVFGYVGWLLSGWFGFLWICFTVMDFSVMAADNGFRNLFHGAISDSSSSWYNYTSFFFFFFFPVYYS